jgi:cytochrome c oxidase subunit 2
MGSLRRFAALAAGFVAVGLFGAPAMADQPRAWEMGFQEPASTVMERINDFHNLLLIITTAIVIFVLVLMAYVMLRFNAKANPTPSRTTHNTLLEVVWTVVPIIILVVIAVPSFKLVYYADKAPNAEVTLKITANQFFWTYEYPDEEGLTFDAIIKAADDLADGEPRLLATDNAVVLPVDTDVRLLSTANDVIHAWAVPAFGVKFDAVPGRLNESWVRITKEGTYYGQCSELCGSQHGFMPIMVKAVSKDAYRAWVEQAKKQFATRAPESPARLALAVGANGAATREPDLRNKASIR